MNFLGQSTVRRFAVSTTTGKIVVKTRSCDKCKGISDLGKCSKCGGVVKELCEVPGRITFRELRERGESITGMEFKHLSGRRHDSDVIAATPEGIRVSTIQIENVYNDWLILSAMCGVGMYEHIANAHELQILEIARKMFGS